MIRAVLLSTVAAAVLAGPALAQDAGQARVLEILKTTPLIDGHNDLPWALREGYANDVHAVDLTQNLAASTKLHTDIPRLRAGGVGGQFWSVYVPADLTPLQAVEETFEQIDTAKRIVAAHPETFGLATTADEVEAVFASGRIANLIGMEGGYSIDGSLALLREFYDAGARYMTLTHSKTTRWADSATDAPKWGGLNAFGEEVVKEMNRIGMMVDLSHVSEDTMLDAIRVSEAPVIFSHSSARAITDVPRNVPDNVLRLMPENGGVVMVTFVPGFVNAAQGEWIKAAMAEAARLGVDAGAATPDPRLLAWAETHPRPKATIADIVAHIQHVRDVAGIDHVGLGGDFDGVESLPEGVTGVDAYPTILAALMDAGWTEADIRKLAGENLLRVMRGVEAGAAAKAGARPSLAFLAAD
jgi:membrane dipeptidase